MFAVLRTTVLSPRRTFAHNAIVFEHFADSVLRSIFEDRLALARGSFAASGQGNRRVRARVVERGWLAAAPEAALGLALLEVVPVKRPGLAKLDLAVAERPDEVGVAPRVAPCCFFASLVDVDDLPQLLSP